MTRRQIFTFTATCAASIILAHLIYIRMALYIAEQVQ